MANAARVFEDRPAVREATPLLVGLVGPSGAGKTFSALRLATGIQKVSGGDVFVIDTESRRALHYAERFKFRHIAFGAPFGPLDYLAAVEHCVAKGAKTIIVDSMSHEHEGPGGVLEMHEAELTRMAGDDYGKRERMKMLAWQKPKQQRRRMINTLLQINCNFIFCFRAKEKLKLVRGKEPENLGFMPIAGEEFVYEMTLKCLLLPGANGAPVWESEHSGERMMMKLPDQFRDVFAGEPRQLDETTGTRLAEWAAGAPPVNVDALLAQYAAVTNDIELQAAERARADVWGRVAVADKARLKEASDAAKERARRATDAPTDGPL